MRDIKEYEDIINMPHHISMKHPQMSIYDRAAQFSPFAALTGHSEAIKETERLTQKRMVLSDDEKAYLDARLSRITTDDGRMHDVSVTYFVEDGRKEGGSYLQAEGRIKKVDMGRREIVMEDGTGIPIGDISDIEGEIFMK